MNYWYDDLECGILTIDDQHKNMCGSAIKLFEAFVDGRMDDEITKCMRHVEDYITTHYICEEKIMEKLNYPKYLEHKEEHRKFCVKYYDLRDQYLETKNIDEKFIKDFNAMVIEWMITHYREDDFELAKFLKQHKNPDLDKIAKESQEEVHYYHEKHYGKLN